MVRDDAFYWVRATASQSQAPKQKRQKQAMQSFSLFSVASSSNRGKVLSFGGRFIGQVVRFDVVYVYRQAKLRSRFYF